MSLGETTVHITVPMYEKGRSFIMAGSLVKAYEGHRFVYLHLLCQGFENIGKALLLARDYEKFGPLLKSKYGHNLESLLADVNQVFGRNFLSSMASAEILALNQFYKQHQLRYGDLIDFSDNSSCLLADQLHSELVGHLDELNQNFASYGRDT
jgi:hypothetical protein